MSIFELLTSLDGWCSQWAGIVLSHFLQMSFVLGGLRFCTLMPFFLVRRLDYCSIKPYIIYYQYLQ